MTTSTFVFMVLMLLAGCKSEGAFIPADATLIEVTVTPSPIYVLEGRELQLIATAKYDDESEKDVTNSVTWEIIGDPTIAKVTASGLLTGNIRGNTELTASKDGITSNIENVNVCNLADACIDIFNTGSGKLFTSSPSVDYLDRIGGSATNGPYTETYGASGSYYIFDWDNADALCATYNTNSIGGRNNWRLAEINELENELFDVYGDMTAARGWPNSKFYWSATPDVTNYYALDLYFGTVVSGTTNSLAYVSCVSDP
ncbi:DUF1566 domain-containing protein [Vibrio brasiliensis]|uniref:Lcl domain-containing protein n=1 Tax=Vibrio brasiliensis TaxID=170652 RepID=UPI001EFE7BEB|nr:DUF1566 domain-containing protein [Vibrio brasiliensis]MCG9753500.1 DUF1566 domain-containing protein [Vibrio brasiliensis]